MPTTETQDQQIQAYREQALAALEAAQHLDNKKPFAIIHQHAYGETVYMRWFDHTPDREECAKVLDSVFEEDIESLTCAEMTLQEVVGVSVAEPEADAAEENTPAGRA